MGASFYGQHMVWHSGMTPEEHQQRLDFKDLLKEDEARRDEYREVEAAKIDTKAQRAIEGTLAIQE